MEERELWTSCDPNFNKHDIIMMLPNRNKMCGDIRSTISRIELSRGTDNLGYIQGRFRSSGIQVEPSKVIGGFQSSRTRLKLVPSAARSHLRNSKLNSLHFGYAQTFLLYRFFNSSHFVKRLRKRMKKKNRKQSVRWKHLLYSDVCPNLQISQKFITDWSRADPGSEDITNVSTGLFTLLTTRNPLFSA